MNLQLLTVGEVAEMLRCGVSTVWRWRKKGKIPQPIHINGTTRWRLNDIQEFIEAASTARIQVKPEASAKTFRVKSRPRQSCSSAIA